MRILVNGGDTFVATGGKDFDPALPAIIFLHGAGMDHSVWALLARSFAHHGYAVLAPDFPGHGRSAGTPLSSIAALADWTAALIDAAGAKTARLVGHSMGSLVALGDGGAASRQSHRAWFDRNGRRRCGSRTICSTPPKPTIMPPST